MEKKEKEIIAELTNAVSKLSQGQRVNVNFETLADSDTEEVMQLKAAIAKLAQQYNDNYAFVLDIAKGKLDTTPPSKNSFANPYKQLHADLLHLTWQIKQISEGDYDQKVSFSGDFSAAINKMIASLREKQRIDELNVKYLNELRELNATKDRFFSIIAHDLKNPFTGLLGFSDILLSNLHAKDYETAEEFATIIKGLSEQGYKLLVNLLEWARSQLDAIKINIEPVSLKVAMDDSKSIVSAGANKKNIEILYDCNLDYKVFADTNILKTILRNLLSNAVKYCNGKGVIRISAERKGKYIVICVSDNGVGIKKENLSRLFRIDSKVSTKGTDNEDGTGLGLILCKEFANKLGGDISVESTEGKGTKFFVSLPEAE
ncbi:MAG: HAMP domain-containing sensor histidine kinase [Bacteroidales bacterium]